MKINLKELLKTKSYIKVQDNAEIDTNENSVIFGSNGIGKTTIYEQLKNNYPEFDYLDYEKTKELFKKNKKTIQISLGIEKLEKLTERNKELSEELSVKNRVKHKGITNIQKAKNISKLLTDKFKKNEIDQIVITKEDCKEIDKVHFYVRYILENKKKLAEIVNISEELKIIDQNYLRNALQAIDQHLKPSDEVCPICGSKVPYLKQIVNEKIENLSKIKNELLESFANEYNKHDNTGTNIQDEFNLIVEIAKKYDEEVLVEYYIIDGKIEDILLINSSIDEKRKIEKEYFECLTKQKELFNSLKNQQFLYTDHLKRYFNADVTFDDENKVVTVSFERNVDKYSTGELDMILFITKIFSYLGNDKKCLFIDDPISSYDLVNQYNIVFHLCKLIENKNKHVVVFTHNPNVINIINSQNNKSYKYFFFDLVNGEIIINTLPSEMKYNSNVLDLRILTNDEDEYSKYISLMLCRNDKNQDDYLSSILHFDSDTRIIELDKRAKEYEKCTNKFFIDYIENNKYSKDFVQTDFDHLCKSKIIAITSIRIWIEYKLCNSTSELLKGTYGEKVNKYFNNKDKITIPYNNLKKENLMSKKVMLNQNCHVHSQVQPFFYALSIKTDDIIDEIKDVKSLFSINENL